MDTTPGGRTRMMMNGGVALAAVIFSVRTPTTNPFLTNSKKSDDRNVLQTHINTVDDRTFPTVHAATPRALYIGILCGAKIEPSSLII